MSNYTISRCLLAVSEISMGKFLKYPDGQSSPNLAPTRRQITHLWGDFGIRMPCDGPPNRVTSRSLEVHSLGVVWSICLRGFWWAGTRSSSKAVVHLSQSRWLESTQNRLWMKLFPCERTATSSYLCATATGSYIT